MPLMPVCELWTPDTSGVFLRCAAGSYTGHDEFGEMTQGVVFAKGEGLPGRVWASKHPEILATLGAPSDFIRAKAAAATGLTAGIAIPILRHGAVVAVLNFLTAQHTRLTGIMEVWSPTYDGSMLAWHSGFYGPLSEIRDLRVATRFSPGEGLPGRAWKNRRPELVTKLTLTTDNFIRQEVAQGAGLTTGLSLPIMQGPYLKSVVTLLSTAEMPFGQVVELWEPNEDGTRLVRRDGYYGRFGKFYDEEADRTFELGEGLPGQVWESGMPQLIAPLDRDSGFSRYQAAQSSDLSVAIGIPVIDNEKVTSVVLLLA
ncbi:MAG: GAF domain-containing protein [Myxococcales bacterium]|nr:GAF domain-containing protein [Myxococcales bacterium]